MQPTDSVHIDLDNCLLQLGTLLRKMGVEEFSFSDHYHHHSVSEDAELDKAEIHAFCQQIRQLYSRLVNTGEI